MTCCIQHVTVLGSPLEVTLFDYAMCRRVVQLFPWQETIPLIGPQKPGTGACGPSNRVMNITLQICSMQNGNWQQGLLHIQLREGQSTTSECSRSIVKTEEKRSSVGQGPTHWAGKQTEYPLKRWWEQAAISLSARATLSERGYWQPIKTTAQQTGGWTCMVGGGARLCYSHTAT